MNKRIAVFQYDWPLQSYSRDLLIKLSEEGFHVSFFYYKIFEYNLVDTTEFEKRKIELFEFLDTEHIIDHIEKNHNKVVSTIFKKIFWHFLVNYLKYFLDLPVKLLDKNVLYQSNRTLKKTLPFDFFIGIEKTGLIWASLLAEKHNTPTIYYSLELYLEDMEDSPIFKLQQKYREAEKQYHQKALATIIQDRFRADALFKYNHTNNRVITLPVSVRGKEVKEKSDYFHRKFGLPQNKKILLYFGIFMPNRFCKEIIESANLFSEYFITVFHGYGDEKYINELKAIAHPEKIFFSMDLVNESGLSELLSSADIGFALYNNQYLNDRFTAFSSQKIALFCKHGLPFIAMQNESYEELHRHAPCCRMIGDFDEMPVAVDEIADQYDSYRNAAFLAYDRFFNFDKQFNIIAGFLSGN
jgi:hypothetical protein